MLELKNISKTFSGFSLDDISFTAEQGSYFVLLGPSGAGKSLTLEIIAGLVRPDRGSVVLNGRDITHTEIHHRPVGLVFQEHCVFPHLSVRENIAYPLKIRKRKARDIKKLVNRLAGEMNIEPLLDRNPESLSGGELQRVTLARILAADPEVILLDEPLSSLDIQLQQELRGLLKDLNKKGRTIIHVTHNFEEAIVLADKVAVMKDGKIIQSGTKDDVFHHPGSEFVARLTGIKNYFRSVFERDGDQVFARISDDIRIRVLPEEKISKGFIIITGEDIILSGEQITSSVTNSFRGVVTDVIPLFNGYEIAVDTGVTFYSKISGESFEKLGIHNGKPLWVSFKAAGVRLLAE